MKPLRVAIIGFGKIAGDSHVPAIAGNPRVELAASVSRSGAGPEPRFESVDSLLASGLPLDAAAITTPPGARYDIARKCLDSGLHLLLEKPPTVTLGEIDDLACHAEMLGLTLFTSWHSRHNRAVEMAAAALAGKRIETMDIVWHEDVDKWHPGQDWIWKPGGFGVFDPGINALAIAAAIFPGTLTLSSARLIYRAGDQTPIAAALELASAQADGPLRCSFDWRRSEGEEWTIEIVTTDRLRLRVEDGGARLLVDGKLQPAEPPDEYGDIYRRFVSLIDQRRSEVDTRPLRLVADALLVGCREEV